MSRKTELREAESSLAGIKQGAKAPSGKMSEEVPYVSDANKLLAIPMSAVRGEVLRAFPFLEGKCDIDLALAYEAMVKGQSNGRFHISFPKRPMVGGGKWWGCVKGCGKECPHYPPFTRPIPRFSGVQVGTLKSRRIRATRSQVVFNYLYLTT